MEAKDPYINALRIAKKTYALGDHLHPWKDASVDLRAAYYDAAQSEIHPSAEQHALDNPGHVLVVIFQPVPENPAHVMLMLDCVTCSWWDQQ